MRSYGADIGQAGRHTWTNHVCNHCLRCWKPKSWNTSCCTAALRPIRHLFVKLSAHYPYMHVVRVANERNKKNPSKTEKKQSSFQFCGFVRLLLENGDVCFTSPILAITCRTSRTGSYPVTSNDTLPFLPVFVLMCVDGLHF